MKTKLKLSKDSKPKMASVFPDNRDKDKAIDKAKGVIDEILGDVSKTSAAKQLALGSASGWLTGFLTMKVGKMAAIAVGGGIIILQIAQHKGYIKIDWERLQKHADKVADRIEKEATGKGPSAMDKIISYAKNNQFVAAGFAGGFLIGLAVS